MTAKMATFTTPPKRSQLGALFSEPPLTSNSFDTVTPHHLMKTSITWLRSMTMSLGLVRQTSFIRKRYLHNMVPEEATALPSVLPG